jgi:hypothetical protein
MTASQGVAVRRPLRIANCSGFYGDRLSAAREMVDGGPIDVLTGDYLAELTMLILWKARRKDPARGYATTFLRQMEDVLGTCLDRGIKVVSNAGGLNPSGLAEALGQLGLGARIAYLDGDDVTSRLDQLVDLDTGQPLAETELPVVTANAYLGGWGIAAALEAGADVVVCPRVTDASLVTGPAAWWHGWRRDDWDALAGAVAAGHIIECGPQATGGNYSFLGEIRDRRRPGFPIAEVGADGSAVITKHPGSGGLVSVGTVTAQLLYEIDRPAYANPDVTADFGSVSLAPEAPDRVLVSGAVGGPPPPSLKVALNMLGGWRNTMTMVLTGLDVEEKAAYATSLLFGDSGGKDEYDEVDVRLMRFDHPGAVRNEEAVAHLRITVKDADEARVGRAFADRVTELALGSYAGFHTTTPPTPAAAYGIYRPALIPPEAVVQTLHRPDGGTEIVPHTAGGSSEFAVAVTPPMVFDGPRVEVPLGRVCGARSGDKGGNANVGIWARDDRGFAWLRQELTVPAFRELLPEAAALEIRRYELPNLRAVNFVVVGIIAPGVAATTRPDAQAKGLGEFLRARTLPVPAELLD